MGDTVSSLIASGRDALARRDWSTAFDLLLEADAAEILSADDLNALADAAWASGGHEACVDARQRAYTRWLDEGDERRAAFAALMLARHYFAASRGDYAVAIGWRETAQRLLAELSEGVEHGHLAWNEGFVLFLLGGFDEALASAKTALDLAKRFGDRDLHVLALDLEGMSLVWLGRITEGMARLDEAMTAAVSRQLAPWPTEMVLCHVIGACQTVGDYRRAGEWIQAAMRSNAKTPIVPVSGDCRLHHADILRLRGQWDDAEAEAGLACEECGGGDATHTGLAHTQIGFIRLRRGDLVGAERSFQLAHEHGTTAHPGFALIRLAEGKIDVAASSVARALEQTLPTSLAYRTPLLAAQVEIALAASDTTTAVSAAEELETIAARCGTSAYGACAKLARGRIDLVTGDASSAVRSLSEALRLWQEADVPYEAAVTRVLLAQVHRATGDAESAMLELRSASSVFEKLGATPDLSRVEALLAELSQKPVEHTVAKTFMFTDIVRSTELVEAMGDEAWADVLRWHDTTLRSLIAAHDGEEVDHTGDGFFVAFEDAWHAIECAVAIQRALAEHRRSHGFSPRVRIGLHETDATQTSDNYRGKGVHRAARIGALAGAEEILASEKTAFGTTYSVSDPQVVELKGVAEPVRIVVIEWRS